MTTAINVLQILEIFPKLTSFRQYITKMVIKVGGINLPINRTIFGISPFRKNRKGNTLVKNVIDAIIAMEINTLV
ncbi:MAG: hypothetical protein P4L35_13445 [Ignavibacteriaceae bacterium]|nr:hypothetical protein [Ignavibacteriaceae bacterium]